jgi:hypothetical protein
MQICELHVFVYEIKTFTLVNNAYNPNSILHNETVCNKLLIFLLVITGARIAVSIAMALWDG